MTGLSVLSGEHHLCIALWVIIGNLLTPFIRLPLFELFWPYIEFYTYFRAHTT